ncbi:RDD family protein [Oleiagrimonas soli]|uniref:Putative RDD family membrane protein YckC n=1 Tax=Oleiagrimonas soli TaxID=1543381 RepID=A0A841KLV9_9GAMM|nr:RDD family protein [Oleiagrimonas soli]MBB6184887.1 putative RDD family membrane protein YckC [Oleiagrimonas soli]
MTEAMYSVTVTGQVQSGRDAPSVWERVAQLLKLDAIAFSERVLARVPVTLKAVPREAAERQLEALTSCGAEAVMLEEGDAPRLWVRMRQGTRGPLSVAYVRHALAAGQLAADTQACAQDAQQWRSLREWMPAPGAPAPMAPREMPASAPAAAASDAPLQLLPTKFEYPGLHAGFWLRFLAYLIDTLALWVPLSIVDVVLMIPLGGRPEQVGATLFSVYATNFLLMLVYFALFESSPLQATPGKLALGLRVTDECGRRIGFWRALGRFVGKLFSGLILCMGYVMAGFTERKQALHDVLAGCLVVRKTPLAAWRADPGAPPLPRTGLPGWAIGLIVVGVSLVPLSILAAIAIPAYQQYVVRSQVAEGANLAFAPREAVARFMRDKDRPPEDNATLGLPAPTSITGRYVAEVKVDYGDVTVRYGEHAASVVRDRHLLYTPELSHGVVVWKCLSPDLPRKYLPRSCR